MLPGPVVLGCSHKTGTFLLVHLYRLFRKLHSCNATFDTSHKFCGACPTLASDTPLVILDSHFTGVPTCDRWRLARVAMTVREPIDIVVSAYDYHRRNMEAHWTGVALPLPPGALPVVHRHDGRNITMSADFLGCAPNRTHLTFASYMAAAHAAMQHALTATSHRMPANTAADVSSGAAAGSYASFLLSTPLAVGMLAQLEHSRTEACKVAIAYARSQATALVLPLERFADPATAEPAWRALQAFLAAGTGCRDALTDPPQVFAHVAALLHRSRRDEHASSLAAAEAAHRAALARKLDRQHLGGWYARLGAALGYTEWHGTVPHWTPAVPTQLRDEVRALCVGRHADADWL